MICVEDNFAGEKVFEYFQHNDDLRIRQYCRRKIFLKVFRIKMICVEDNFAGGKDFECFQDNDDLRLKQFCSQKSL